MHVSEDMNKRRTRKKHKITFACTENTCRSPMAKVVLENLMTHRGIQDMEVDSVALVRSGSAANPKARDAIKERYGNDFLKDHVPKLVDEKSLGRLVLVMTKAQKEQLVAKLRKLEDKTPVLTVSQLIMPFTERGPREDFGRDITDPSGGSLDVYRDCLSKPEGYISEGQDRILKIARRGLYAGWSRKDTPKACPNCNSTRVVPVSYGLPMPEFEAEHAWYSLIGRDPPCAFGGCCIGIPGQPNWHCYNCGHEWANEHLVGHKAGRKSAEEEASSVRSSED